MTGHPQGPSEEKNVGKKRSLQSVLMENHIRLVLWFVVPLFIPFLGLIDALVILVAAPCAILWRLAKWKFDHIHPGFIWYLVFSIIAGAGFASFPVLISKQGWDWWWETAQICTLISLLLWIIGSAVFMFLAPRRHCLVPISSIIVTMVVFILFVLGSEAGDLRALQMHFLVMRGTGVALAILSVVSLIHIAYERFSARQ